MSQTITLSLNPEHIEALNKLPALVQRLTALIEDLDNSKPALGPAPSAPAPSAPAPSAPAPSAPAPSAPAPSAPAPSAPAPSAPAAGDHPPVSAVVAALQAHAKRFAAHGGAVATLKVLKSMGFSQASQVPEDKRAGVIAGLIADQPAKAEG